MGERKRETADSGRLKFCLPNRNYSEGLFLNYFS